MKRALFCAAVITLGMLIALTACGGTTAPSHSGGGSSTPSQAAATFAVRMVAPLGQILVDGSGRTLYLFEADTTTASTCSGACAQAWPPFLTSGSPQVGSGVMQTLVGTTKRSDGRQQVTYNGHPLYYFTGDRQPGNSKGEGLNAFGAGWYVVSPAGNKIEEPGS